MGQQPNVSVDLEDLPRREAKPRPPERWSPDRPGEYAGPDDESRGGAFGTPGPDAGYALNILGRRSAEPVGGESAADVREALLTLILARTSRMGRAPVPADAEVAEAILGFGDDDPSWRSRWTAGLAHSLSKVQALRSAVDDSALMASPVEVRAMASEYRLLGST